MLNNAKKNKYAVSQFNVNNLEWAKYILEECNNLKVPVILGFSEGAIKYMGGYNVVTSLIFSLIHDLDIEIDVTIHLDHGRSVNSCFKAIDAGFNSVMLDCSLLPLDENIELVKEVVSYAKNHNVTVEGEVGSIGGTEDTTQEGCNASFEDCVRFVKETNIDSLAAAVGSIHGMNQKGIAKLDFDLIEKLNKSISVPLVLHGGSGISDDDIKKSIQTGISKININTELQIAWHKAMLEFVTNNKDVYDPRKIIGSGQEAIKEIVRQKINLFGTK
jgi:fructose-1,6-bisphosphate aldolase class II